jgi:hypothetical protein
MRQQLQYCVTPELRSRLWELKDRLPERPRLPKVLLDVRALGASKIHIYEGRQDVFPVVQKDLTAWFTQEEKNLIRRRLDEGDYLTGQYRIFAIVEEEKP